MIGCFFVPFCSNRAGIACKMRKMPIHDSLVVESTVTARRAEGPIDASW